MQHTHVKSKYVKHIVPVPYVTAYLPYITLTVKIICIVNTGYYDIQIKTHTQYISMYVI